jgi:hypothetical protein
MPGVTVAAAARILPAIPGKMVGILYVPPEEEIKINWCAVRKTKQPSDRTSAANPLTWKLSIQEAPNCDAKMRRRSVLLEHILQ